jgi:hypothetical protein
MIITSEMIFIVFAAKFFQVIFEKLDPMPLMAYFTKDQRYGPKLNLA